LQKGEVSVYLLSYTPDPELVVATAMRQSRYPGGVKDLNLGEEDIIRLINLALQLGHFSVFEHISFTFAIEGISRACSTNLSDTDSFLLPSNHKDM